MSVDNTKEDGMTEKKIITRQDALAGLRDIVARFGPDTTRQCQYVEYSNKWDEDGNAVEEIPLRPHCIVGYFLDANGVPLSELAEMEGSTISESYYLAEVELTRDAARILRTAQTVQDDGRNWGRALDAAIQESEWIENVSNGVEVI